MNYSKNKNRILIVEDELLVAEDISFRLNSLGYQITDTVISGEDALISIEREKPNLILMDIMLKGRLDGIQTHEIIKKKYSIPLVYLTSYSDEKTLSRAKLTQPFGYLIKPFDESDLKTVIEVAIYKHSMEMRLEHQLRSEELISRISTRLLATKTEHLDIAITESLKLFGEYAGIDKCFIFLINDENETYSSFCEWRSQEFFVSTKNVKDISLSTIGWSLNHLMSNEVLKINNLSEMPEEAQTEKLFVESLGVKSYVAVGLKHNDRIKGVIGFDSILHEKNWEERELFAVRLFSEIIANTLERKQVENQLLESEKNLRDLNAAKDKFFSIIAHDLKNPFMGILGFTEILNNSFEQYDDTEKQKMILFIKRSAESAYKLLENLLEWSRIQIGAWKTNQTNCDISVLINESITSLKDMALSKKIKILTAVENETYVYVDEEMIKAVIRNLLTNAIKFSHPGGHVKITMEDLKEKIKLSIADNGVGINKEALNSLFRIDKSITTKGTLGEKGTGLGLILCREFVEMNNGTITTESTENEGSVFSVLLPKNAKFF